MPNLIPGDARGRMTFDYLETGWHEGMNFVITDLVAQTNALESDWLTGKELLEGVGDLVHAHSARLVALESSIEGFVSRSAYDTFTRTLAVYRTTAPALEGATTLAVEAPVVGTVQPVLYDDDRLLAVDPATYLPLTELVVDTAAPIAAGSALLTVEPAGANLPAGTLLFVPSSWQSARLRLLSDSISSVVTELTRLDGELTEQKSMIEQQADLLLSRVSHTTLEAGPILGRLAEPAVGEEVEALALTALSGALRAGVSVLVVDPVTEAITEFVVGAGGAEASEGPTTVPVLKRQAEAPAGATVHLPLSQLFSAIVQTPESVQILVEDLEAAMRALIEVEADRITSLVSRLDHFDGENKTIESRIEQLADSVSLIVGVDEDGDGIISLGEILARLELAEESFETTVRRLDEMTIVHHNGQTVVGSLESQIAQLVSSISLAIGHDGDGDGVLTGEEIVAALNIYAQTNPEGKITGGIIELAGMLQSGKGLYSEAYQAGVSGWAISGDGGAEFNSVTMRGAVYADFLQIREGDIRTRIDGNRVRVYHHLYHVSPTWETSIGPGSITLIQPDGWETEISGLGIELGLNAKIRVGNLVIENGEITVGGQQFVNASNFAAVLPTAGITPGLMSVQQASTLNSINTRLGTNTFTVTNPQEGQVLAYVSGAWRNTAGGSGGGGPVTWSSITGKPTTLGGYGITDAATTGHTHTSFGALSTGTITSSGDIRAAGDVIAGFSDARLKTAIEPLEGALERLLALGAYTFEWTADAVLPEARRRRRDFGLLAQEVETVFPEAVAEMDGYKAVRYDKLVAPLIAAVRALEARLRRLEGARPL